MQDSETWSAFQKSIELAKVWDVVIKYQATA